MAAGHVYIMVNAAMSGYLKIGMTTRTPEERAVELSCTTGVPVPFTVAYSEEVADCSLAERLIHERLVSHRVCRDREFFHLPLRDAIREVAAIAREVGMPSVVAPDGSPLEWCSACKKLVVVTPVEHSVWNGIAAVTFVASFFVPCMLPLPARDEIRTCSDCGAKLKEDVAIPIANK